MELLHIVHEYPTPIGQLSILPCISVQKKLLSIFGINNDGHNTKEWHEVHGQLQVLWLTRNRSMTMTMFLLPDPGPVKCKCKP